VEELVLQLHAHHKEEEREQRVRRPRLHGQVQVQRVGSEPQLADRVVRPCKGGVRQDESCAGGGEDQAAAHRLVLEEVGDPPPLDVDA